MLLDFHGIEDFLSSFRVKNSRSLVLMLGSGETEHKSRIFSSLWRYNVTQAKPLIWSFPAPSLGPNQHAGVICHFFSVSLLQNTF